MALPEKTQLHPKNKHRQAYDFQSLSKKHPELQEYLAPNAHGNISLDFANPAAVKALNTAILEDVYGIEFWDIPEGYLCPPIPGRADYLHYLADLIGERKDCRILDIGTGANMIYPLIGTKLFSWKFVGSEIDERAIEHGNHILKYNELEKKIEIRKQIDSKNIFKGIVLEDDKFSASICNPPFFLSAQHAKEANARKWKKLKKTGERNFGGLHHELWCEGGEVGFVKRMIKESLNYTKQIKYFTTLISRKNSLELILPELKNRKHQIIDMAQGRKASRLLVWQ